MVITHDSTVSEIVETLKNEVHGILYNTLDKDLPFMVVRKQSGFGCYLILHQGQGVLASLKCSPELESFVMSKNLVIQALRELGYEVKD